MKENTSGQLAFLDRNISIYLEARKWCVVEWKRSAICVAFTHLANAVEMVVPPVFGMCTKATSWLLPHARPLSHVAVSSETIEECVVAWT